MKISLSKKEQTILDLLAVQGEMFVSQIVKRSRDDFSNGINPRIVLHTLVDKGHIDIFYDRGEVRQIFCITRDGEKARCGDLDTPVDQFKFKDQYLRSLSTGNTFLSTADTTGVMVYSNEQRVLALIDINGPLSVVEMARKSQGLVSRTVLYYAAKRMVHKGYLYFTDYHKQDTRYCLYMIAALGIKVLRLSQVQYRAEMSAER